MILDALIGIIDPLRSDVVAAVKICQKAGIFVRMVTGDNLETAKAIAKQAGILTNGTLR
jgi:P-type E1-E2 ATPase